MKLGELNNFYLHYQFSLKGFVQDGQGRVSRRLEQFGDLLCLVVGTFNEVSTDTLVLLDAMADSRVSKLARASGLQKGRFEAEKGLAQAQLRRWLSTVSLRAAMACTLDRVHQIGDGAALISKRREETMVMERRMAEEREVQWLAKTRGRNVLRRGHIYLQ